MLLSLLDAKQKKKKGTDFFAKDEELDDEWIKEWQAKLVEEERAKITKSFAKANEKLQANGEKPQPDKELKEKLKAADELAAMEGWIAGVVELLRKEDEIVAAERAERAGWAWMDGGGWTGREVEREHSFLKSLHAGLSSSDRQDVPDLPEWTPAAAGTELPTPFLLAMQNGLLLVRLHNVAVRKSRRRFGAVATFHTDTAKPYRAADNLRYWAKAAELRWEVDPPLKFDPLAVAYGSNPEAWQDLDAAILRWCQRVREEITADYAGDAS